MHALAVTTESVVRERLIADAGLQMHRACIWLANRCGSEVCTGVTMQPALTRSLWVGRGSHQPRLRPLRRGRVALWPKFALCSHVTAHTPCGHLRKTEVPCLRSMDPFAYTQWTTEGMLTSHKLKHKQSRMICTQGTRLTVSVVSSHTSRSSVPSRSKLSVQDKSSSRQLPTHYFLLPVTPPWRITSFQLQHT